MAYKVIILYQLYMPSYFLGTFTEYPYSKEIKDLAIVWCYYSGKREGNTYTYVKTEALLKDGITSEKRDEDAKMLKNLYHTFINELEYIHKEKNKEIIDERRHYSHIFCKRF